MRLLGLAAKNTWSKGTSPAASAAVLSIASVITLGTLLRAAFALPVHEGVKITTFSISPKLGTQVLKPPTSIQRREQATFVLVYPSCDSCSLRRPSDKCLRDLADNQHLVIAVPDRKAKLDMERVVGQGHRAVALSLKDSQDVCDVLGDAATLAQLDTNGRLVAYWGSRNEIENQSRRMH